MENTEPRDLKCEMARRCIKINSVYVPKTKSNRSSNFLKVYFDFASIFGISPFRLKFVNDHYIICSRWPQKLAATCFGIVALLWLQATIRDNLSYEKKLNPSSFLSLMSALITVSIKSLTLKCFWTKQAAFLRICNIADSSHHESSIEAASQSKLSIKSKAILICMLYTFVIFLEMFAGGGLRINREDDLEHHLYDWNINWWWARVVHTGHFMFFMEGFDGKKDKLWLDDRIIGAFTVLGFYTRRILSLYCDLLITMCVLTVWTEAKHFQDKVLACLRPCNATHPVISTHWKEMLNDFKYLQHFTVVINETVGMNVMLQLVEILLFYSTSFDKVFVKTGGQQNYLMSGIFLFYFANIFTVYLVAANIPYMMHSVVDFLAVEDNRKGMPVDQLVIVLNEIESGAVSIKGNSILPITYPALANILGTTVTYFIICLQTGMNTC